MLVGTADWAFKNNYYSSWVQYSKHVLECKGEMREKTYLDESFGWGACACDEYLDCGSGNSTEVRSRLCSVRGANHDCSMTYPAWKMAWEYLEVERKSGSISADEVLGAETDVAVAAADVEATDLGENDMKAPTLSKSRRSLGFLVGLIGGALATVTTATVKRLRGRAVILRS